MPMPDNQRRILAELILEAQRLRAADVRLTANNVATIGLLVAKLNAAALP